MMHRGGRLITTLVAVVLTTVCAVAQLRPAAGTAPALLGFTENRGQVLDTRGRLRPDILYTAASSGATLYFRRSGFSYVFLRPSRAAGSAELAASGRSGASGVSDASGTPDASGREGYELHRVDMELVGADPAAVVDADEETGAVSTFYRPSAPRGIAGVRSFRRLVYREVYPRIDFVVRGGERGLKYEFIVHPGGDPGRILLRYHGASSVEPTRAGGLRVTTPLGAVEEGRPFSYSQDPSIDGPVADAASGDARAAMQAEVASAFRVAGQTVGFEVGGYDRSRPLVIDPVLTWSSYLGGTFSESSLGASGGYTIAVDGGRNLLVATSTLSTNFPVTTGAWQGSISGQAAADLAVVKMSTSGRVLWSTYFGGTDMEAAGGLAVDPSGNVIVGGTTRSGDFPVSPMAFQTVYQGNTDCFLISLAGLNGARLWGTYVGGNSEERIGAVAVDPAGNIALAGGTRSNGMATPGVFQSTRAGTQLDGMAMLFTSAGSRLWSTYVGGTSDDVARGVAFDGAGNMVVAGETASRDLATTTGAFQTTAATGAGSGPSAGTNGFIAQLTPLGASGWVTYIGGGADRVLGVAAASDGDVTVCGSTTSGSFPTTPGALQRAYGGVGDGFAARFTSTGAIRWSTYLGGSLADELVGVTADGAGGAIVTGYSESVNFPVTANALLRTRSGTRDAVIARLDSAGRPLWSTYLGGTGSENGEGAAISGGAVFMAGVTSSADFPIVQGAAQGRLAGETDLFVAAICDLTTHITADGPLQFCDGDSVLLSAPAGFRAYRWSTGATARSIYARTGDRFWVWVDDGLCTGYSDTLVTTLYPKPTVSISPGVNVTICEGDSVVLEATAGYRSYSWSTGATTRRIVVHRFGRYTVTVTNDNDCQASATTEVVVNPRSKPTITGGPLVICAGDSAVLDAGPDYANYAWSSGGTSRRAVIRAPGTYAVTVMNSFGCRATSDSVTVVVRPRPSVRVIPLGSTVICQGDSVALQASLPDVTYRWSTGATTRTIWVSTPGIYSVSVEDGNGCAGVSQPVEIRTSPRPAPVIVPDRPVRFCQGDSIILDAGGPYYSYLWSTGERTRQIIVKQSGSYGVTVSNEIGCEVAAAPLVVTVDPRPQIDITGPGSVCSNAESQYEVADGYTLHWTVEGGDGVLIGDPSSRSITVRWGATGTGVIRVRAVGPGAGCVSEKELVVAVGAGLVPVVIADRLRLCGDDSVTLDAGPGYASYLWSTGERTRRIVVRKVGDYFVDVVDESGCRGRSKVVAVRAGLESRPVVTASDGTSICAGEVTVLDAGAGYASYLWSNGMTTRTIAVRDSGIYQVTVANAGGCTGTSSPVRIVVRPSPDATISGPVIVCSNSTIVYSAVSATGVVYDWRVDNGDVIAGQGTSQVSIAWRGDGTGEIRLRVRSLDGCVDSSAHEVTVGDRLVPVVWPSGAVPICADESAVLDAGAGYASYLWSNGMTTRTIAVSSAGSYSVRVTAPGGCSGVSEPVSVVLRPRPAASVTPTGPIRLCDGDPLVLTAGGDAGSYLWSTGERSRSITVNSSGRYTVTVTSPDGCSATSEAVVVTIAPRPPVPVIVAFADTIGTEEQAITYQWSRDGELLDGETGRRLVLHEPGRYTVTVGYGGCTSTSLPYVLLNKPSTWLDTISGTVGDRLRLAFRTDPPLTEMDSVTGYSVRFTINRSALFPHRVIDMTALPGQMPARMLAAPDGLVKIDRDPGDRFITGGTLFELELEGLATGEPVNTIDLLSVSLLGKGSAQVIGDGVVLLSGCDVVRGFNYGRRVTLKGVTPNPVSDRVTVTYRAPAGSEPELRLFDLVGNEVLLHRLEPATGQDQTASVPVGDTPSGVYRLELRDRLERSAVPVMIRK